MRTGSDLGVPARAGRRTAGWITAGLLAAAAGVAVAPATLAQPVVVENIVRPLGGGATTRVYIATVDLLDPSVQIVTTGVAPAGTGDSVLTTVPSWRTTVGARLAINANYFSSLGGGRADIVGLAISNWTAVSPARQGDPLRGDPALVFTPDRRAAVGYVGTADDITGYIQAVAGVGPSATEPGVAGTLLIEDGVNTGATARVVPGTRNPRTAVGVNQAGTQLVIVVSDGLNAGGSAGMTLAEMGTLLLERGVWRAVNLDGGGSSSFLWQPDAGGLVQNVPSDGSFRAVANHLGIRINTAAHGGDGRTRPIRGAWMRPPPLLAGAFPTATFESACSTLAQAGITDLLLETLYWGRDTGAIGDSNFPQRFANVDYLQQAILSANKYGLRVHAWCETGYLDFGTTPSALLQANPTWVVKHLSVARNESTNPDPCNAGSTNTLTGDLANQRFVNLGNPGVRAALSAYFTGLTTNYHGLAGVQADYHFFPIGNPPANQNSVAPWSYDAWALANFRNASNVLTNPLTGVTGCSGSSFNANWTAWNRNNITDALVILRDSVNNVSTSPLFSAVSFGKWSDPIHLSKMADLPSWGTRNAAEAFFIMAYGSSTAGISDELVAAQAALPNRRIVAGLANLPGTRPPVIDQLKTMADRGLYDFAWFRADEFIDGGIPGSSTANPNAPTYRADLRSWIDTRATHLRADVSGTGVSNGRDGLINGHDRRMFSGVYIAGSAVARTAGNDRCDINRDGVIDLADEAIFAADWRRAVYGDKLNPDGRDLQSIIDAFTPGPPPVAGLLNRWDLTGDGKVDVADLGLALGMASLPAPVLDVDGDGTATIDDLYAWWLLPTDVNQDGFANIADRMTLEAGLRAGEEAAGRGAQR